MRSPSEALDLFDPDPQHALLPQLPIARMRGYRAQSSGSGPFKIDLSADLQLTATALLYTMAPQIIGERNANPDERMFSRSSLNLLDRTVVGLNSQAAGLISDGLLGFNMAMPFVATALDHWRSRAGGGASAFGTDSLVLLQTLAVTSMVSNVVKYSFRRPRPFLYDLDTSDSERGHADGTMSFFSGHTSISFAMATSYSYIFSQRHKGSSLVLPVWIGTHALASTTGLMRVLAGKHFWSDVLFGAGVGSALGYFVPFINRRTRGNGQSWLARVTVAPQIEPGGGGASAAFSW